MMLYILPYHIVCYLFSHRSAEISLFPEMASPKFFLNFRELIENLTARYTFQYSNYFRYRISRWKRYQYVNVIFRYFTTVYFKIKMARYLRKKLLNSWTDFINKNFFPVFWASDQMILGFINRMVYFSDSCGYFTWKATFPQAL